MVIALPRHLHPVNDKLGRFFMETRPKKKSVPNLLVSRLEAGFEHASPMATGGVLLPFCWRRFIMEKITLCMIVIFTFSYDTFLHNIRQS